MEVFSAIFRPHFTREYVSRGPYLAQMAELVDALGSGPSGGNTVEVRVLFWAPNTKGRESGLFCFPIVARAARKKDHTRENCYQRPAQNHAK
jgi:hypothetical protein